MPTSFFNNYPLIPYDLYGDGSITALTNITQEVAVTPSKLPDDASSYTYYTIRDGDRPDTVSYDLYGDVQYYWTFFILNSFLKDGLNDAWPLSYLDFNTMIEKEYSLYSVITFDPLFPLDISKTSAMDFSITPLDSKYLPYLRLCSTPDLLTGDSAKILKFDSVRQQLVVYRIGQYSSIKDKQVWNASSRDSFISYPNYYLLWDDSLLFIDIATGKETNPTNEDLKKEWLSIMSKMYTDPNGLKAYFKTDILDIHTDTDDITENINNAIFNHTYKPVSVKSPSGKSSYPYNWSLYYNAASIYYNADGNISTAYDLIKIDPITKNPNTIQPNYKSFQEVESESNDAKTKIKIIRSEIISDFSASYFSALIS